MLTWLFRNRKTGELTIAQAPNLSLWIFIVTFVLRIVVRHGWLHSLLGLVGTLALVWWALDELIRGVNPWRRILGAATLAFILLTRVL